MTGIFLGGNVNQLSNNLAEYAHDAWSKWMKYLFAQSIEEEDGDGAVIVPKEFVERWKRQMNTKYEDLPANEQLSDISEAHEIIAIFDEWTS
jgi:hypothetical protein